MLRRIIVFALAMALVSPQAAAASCAVAETDGDASWAPVLELARHAGPEGHGQRIVASDQYRGDLDARAFAWLGGAGYRRHAWQGPGDVVLLHGFAGMTEGVVLPRPEALTHRLRPWGHELVYRDGARECLQLQAGATGVSLGVRTAPGHSAALLLMLGEGREGMALRTDVPTRQRPATRAQRAAVGAPEGMVVLQVLPREPVQGFTAHLVFARTRNEAEGTLAAWQAEADARFGGDLWAAGLARRRPGLEALRLRTGDAVFDAAFPWAVASNATFRTDEFGPGLWAGLPWFRDNWGRDTFIALPGTHLVTGEFERARAAIANFTRWQNRVEGPEQGRVPNRVAAATDTLYNTVDGTPWLIRAAWETAQASGDAGGLADLRRVIRDYVAGAEPHLDDEGLLRHAEADTWMDARIRGGRGWSPRGDRAIEIQALWHAVLVIAADLALREGDEAEAARYAAMAERTRTAVLARYWRDGRLADRLLADGRVDTSRRPNAWMAVSVPPMPERFPLLPREIEEAVTRDTAAALLLPRGPLSLAPDDPRFHPTHVADAHHHKDAAYHNGTVWPWTAGPAITALTRFQQQETAYRVTRELARQILEDDAPGHLAELSDATLDVEGRVRPSGTYAQSWSTAEFVRNAVQDYLGVRPRLLDGVVELAPALPAAWTNIDAVLPMGDGEPLRFTVTRRDGRQRWSFPARATPLTLELGGMLAAVDGPGVTRMRHAGAKAPRLALHLHPVTFELALPVAAAPWPLAPEPTPPPGGWPVRQGRDVLERFIEAGGLDHHPQPSTAQRRASAESAEPPSAPPAARPAEEFP
jgi:hypothetical protein